MKQISKILLCLFICCCAQKQQPLWYWTLQSRSYARPVIDGGRVYVVSVAGEVIAGEFQKGNQVWTKRIKGSIVAAPVVDSSSIFIGTREGLIISLQKSDGHEQWKRSITNDGFEASLSIFGDQLIAPSSSGTIYALDLQNGTLRWSLTGNRKYNVGGVSDGSYLFIGGWDNNFYALRSDGSVAWQWKAPEAIVDGPLLFRNLVCFATLNRSLIALEKASGKFAWRFDSPNPAYPTQVNQRIAVASNSDVRLLDGRTGQLLRTYKLTDQITDMHEAQNALIIASKGLYRLDLSSGGTTVFYVPTEPFYRFAVAPPLAVITDRLYSVFGISEER